VREHAVPARYTTRNTHHAHIVRTEKEE
jgi:hypothetical protein